jgi:hypothetical protein
MRLEIIIPDSTRPDLKARLTVLTERLSIHPEQRTEVIPDYLAIMDQASSSPNRFKTGAEVDAYISELPAEW